MRFAGWIPKAISTDLEYVILIPFLQQTRLPERVSILHYTRTLPVSLTSDSVTGNGSCWKYVVILVQRNFISKTSFTFTRDFNYKFYQYSTFCVGEL